MRINSQQKNSLIITGDLVFVLAEASKKKVKTNLVEMMRKATIIERKITSLTNSMRENEEIFFFVKLFVNLLKTV